MFPNTFPVALHSARLLTRTQCKTSRDAVLVWICRVYVKVRSRVRKLELHFFFPFSRWLTDCTMFCVGLQIITLVDYYNEDCCWCHCSYWCCSLTQQCFRTIPPPILIHPKTSHSHLTSWTSALKIWNMVVCSLLFTFVTVHACCNLFCGSIFGMWETPQLLQTDWVV